MIDDDAVKNQSNQSTEGCVAQQQRHALTLIKVARNENVQDRNIYHIINPLSPHVNVPYSNQRTDVVPSAITMKSGLDYANMYHSGMNSIWQNKATLFPNIVVGNDNVEDRIVYHRINPIS